MSGVQDLTIAKSVVRGRIDNMKVIEIPPPQDLHVVTEEYPEGQRHVIRIEFYKMPDNSYYVWPYVRRLVGDGVDS